MGYQEEPKGITRAKLVKEIAKQLEKFIEVCTPPRLDSAQLTDHACRQREPSPSTLAARTTESDWEVSNCIISTSLHWNKFHVVRGNLVLPSLSVRFKRHLPPCTLLPSITPLPPTSEFEAGLQPTSGRLDPARPVSFVYACPAQCRIMRFDCPCPGVVEFESNFPRLTFHMVCGTA